MDKLTLTSVKLELTIASLDAMFLTLPDVLFQVSPMTRPSEDVEWMEIWRTDDDRLPVLHDTYYTNKMTT